MTPRLRILLLQAAAGGAFALVALLVWESGLLTPAPRLARTPRQAHDAIGRLPALRPAMPPFWGTEQDRRNLAVHLSDLGSGGAPRP